LDEKQYVSTHVIGSQISSFQVRKGQVQITVVNEGKESLLSIGARAGSVTICYQGNGVFIEE